MSDLAKAGTFQLGDWTIHRMGYGAMQLAGPGVFGPPRDRAKAVSVLRAAIEAGINHIDTSDYYGPHVVNQIIKEALQPYPGELTLVTKIGFVRGSDGSWNPAQSAGDLKRAVEDNLRNLGIEAMDVVNLRLLGGVHKPAEGSIAETFSAMADLRKQGLIRHIGLSNVTLTQVKEAQTIAPVVCVQNMYNLVQRDDDAMIDALAGMGIAYVPFAPLGGFSPVQSDVLSGVAQRLGATPLQVALAWLLQRSPNILLIPGTSSVGHLQENIAAAGFELPADALAELARV